MPSDRTLAAGETRIDDLRFVTGAGRFADDLVIAGQLAAVFVRSPHAHATIRAVDAADAKKHPGVVAVLTTADLKAAGVGSMSHPMPQTDRHGKPMVVPHRPALASGTVRHVGEPVALVVADTLATAEDAADLVAVEYESLAAIADAGAALAAGAPQLWPEAPGNLAMEWVPPSISEQQSAQAVRIIAEAPHVVRMRLVNQRLAGVPMETRGATAVFDSVTGKFTLHAPSQSAHALKGALAGMMGIAPETLRVISGDVGGAFGLKTPPYPEHAALLAAAKLTGRPVHWVATRSEAFLSDHQGRDNVTEAELALDKNGRFLALNISAVVNLGAYASQSGAVIATLGFANCFPTIYDIRHVALGVRLAYTNTVPTGAYRGAGRPEANYVMERLVDEAARRLAIDPIALRRRNMIQPAAIPYRSPLGATYDSGDFGGALDKATALADIAGFPARRAASAERGLPRGLGISCFLEHAGGGPTEGAEFAFEDNRSVVRLGMQASGQGHAIVFRRLVARLLGVAEERVTVNQGDSEVRFRGGPAVGSRSTNAAGAAIHAGVGQLVARAREAASPVLQAATNDIRYADGYVEVVGTNRRMSLFDLARQTDLSLVVQADATNTYPNGCHIAEIEVDPDTGYVTLAAYTAVDDCGVVLDHMRAEAQIAGGVAQGLGQALMERVVYDEAGQLLSGSITDYAMPRAADLPMLNGAFHEIPCKTNALGVKGIGEAGSTAAIAAIMNALADAIPGGWAIDMPATPEKVWRACSLR